MAIMTSTKVMAAMVTDSEEKWSGRKRYTMELRRLEAHEITLPKSSDGSKLLCSVQHLYPPQRSVVGCMVIE